MSKVYVRQVPPEYQESPLLMTEWDEVTHPGLVVRGNPDYHVHIIPVWSTWQDNWEYAWDSIQEFEPSFDGEPADLDLLEYKTVREVIEDLLPPQPERGPYTDAEIDKWVEVLKDMNDCPPSEEYRPTLNAMKLLTGHEWNMRTIRGSCQHEWQECYYDTTMWTDEAIEEIEIEYFNEGAEWCIHDEDTIPNGPDEIEGYYAYTHGWREEDIRKELAEIAGCQPEDLVIYKHSGYTQVSNYEVMD